MKLPKYFISCDWGTSNFRLRLINYKSLALIQQIKSPYGVRKHDESYKASSSTSREDYFWQFIQEHIDQLPEEHHHHPVVISGMASSNIGMKELPYAEFPIKTDGSSLIHQRLSLSAGADIILVSGVKSDHGMMRGEEIQAIGLSYELLPYQVCILLLPGTHSKHIVYKAGQYIASKNYMTGERFDLLSTESLLSESVTKGEWYPEEFAKGVMDGANHLLSEKLFSIRASHILHGKNTDHNYCYLSGLLIGDELSFLTMDSTKICLAAAVALSGPYRQALHIMNVSEERIHMVDSKGLELALIRGQKKILRLYVS